MKNNKSLKDLSSLAIKLTSNNSLLIIKFDILGRSSKLIILSLSLLLLSLLLLLLLFLLAFNRTLFV